MHIFWRVLIINGGEFVKGFFCIYWNYHMVFIFQFVNMVYHIDWFACTEESFHCWSKPKLIIEYELFDVLLNSVCKNFAADLCIYIDQWYWPVVSFLLLLLFCLCLVWYQGDGGLVECVWKCSFLFNILREFYKDRH